MIPLILAVAAASAAPPAVNVQRLLNGADHAVQVSRLDQAAVMLGRAKAAGATGARLERIQGDLALASGKYAEALRHYDALLRVTPKDKALLERTGLAALQSGNVERASALLSQATASGSATWRAWNAMGVIADQRSDWTTADADYAEAARLAPDAVGPINNHGWSLLLRGDWKEAASFFQKAVAANPESERAANNLELARAALSAELPQRRVGETDVSWAARLNDAGVAAASLGDKRRAAAAFTQALNISGSWYARAANNLQALNSK